ncbi:hypothetical protein YPPY66_2741 [Yersinia pestis PY-66]|nr:hypothetical protein YPPY03_2527 [Yersinia pestis PY-03]EIR31858.1 hypothetical protein YPPY10_2556 [Yersinia pestis PY-10]EIR33522.1 hypothetical protein YPPY11_2620 [Yersinia pestis PY-11]EIR46180.1 hypothetical protein YPPY13_2526 [Yersinia pestis PY-13]EIR60052.1 hypothetical protein YPPY16_2533 [Yersinia pestis PY-16]EIR60881.1 hypothetical protein YPPY19_2498 [Yersinia pestis PY-19]EIR90780.1 hypothetical protein YPPY42_2542 [Yersinia pestis PY-42]EIS18583.1 hypothetical protein YPP
MTATAATAALRAVYPVIGDKVVIARVHSMAQPTIALMKHWLIDVVDRY